MIRAVYQKVVPYNTRTLVHKMLAYGKKQPSPHDEREREIIANKYIKGNGVEIGALHCPLKVPRSATVKYVDRMSVPDLLKQYPELSGLKLVETDIICDGERLDGIQDATQDFVIANHFIEHCQNPLMALSNIFRVLKNGGLLYLAVPDKRFTFDIDRPVTPLDHVFRDFEEGGEWSKKQHFEEWVKFVNKVEDSAEAAKQVDELMNIDYSIHFHVWTQTEMLELLLAVNRKLNLRFDVETLLKNGDECIFILRKMN